MSQPSFRPPANLGAPKEKMGGGEKVALGCLAVIFVPVVLVIVAIVVGSISGGDDEPNRFEAIRYCEDAVRDELLAPSTAEFDSVSTDASPFLVSGTVDAENGFGAMVRSEFACTVTISGDSYTATIDRLD